MNNEEAKQRAKNYMSLKGALEPKQIKCYCGHTIMCDCSPIDEPKQETLEETAEKYSEEDMKQAYLDGCKIKLTNIYHLEKWFEKFKKK